MKHNRYLVHFYYFDRKIACSVESNDSDVVTNIRSGFWIDNFLELTSSQQSADRCYWIPPCKLIAIEKIK